ncbi:MAG: glycoside hydrolase family 32 protein [Bacillota bacterium]
MKNQKLSDFNKNERPVFHLTPEVGWMNDPNGFSIYGDECHLFYQCYPEATRWGPTRWGHVKSSDFIRWERLPDAIVPDQEYDIGGCFSGTATEIVQDNAKAVHMLMYTGCRPDHDDPEGRGIQTQCIAFGDGIEYGKHDANPVITEAQLPEGSDPHEFRDPKLWQEADGTFRAIVANHDPEKGTRLLLFRSEDGRGWKYSKVFAEETGAPERMWECPDFFPLGDRHVILVSVMNEVGSLCITGRYDRETETFIEETRQTLDQGLDFYAGQTLAAPDGRRILTGWMQNPQTAENREADLPVNGQMSLPRELELMGSRIIQRPVRELESYRTDEVIHRNVRLTGAGERKLEGVSGRTADIEISVRPDGDETYGMFRMRFAGDSERSTEFRYEPESSEVMLGSAKTKVRNRNGRLDVRLILDRLSAEIFINDGEQVMSAVIYTDRHAEDITFYVKGAAVMDIAKYRIKENK